MNIFCYIFFGAFALAGAWFVFYKAGHKLGSYLMNRHYSFDVTCPMSLKEIDEMVSHWNWSEKTEPFAIIKPERWKYFE